MVGELPRDYLEVVREHLLRAPPASSTPYHRGRRSPAGLRLERGLTDIELGRLERDHGLRFPSDLRSLLRLMLPVHPDFPDWRNDAADELAKDEEWLLRGIWGDVDGHDYFAMNERQEWELVPWQCRTWYEAWGPAPRDREAAYAIVCDRFQQAPRLIRIYAHRFMPATPCEAGNPVFSVIQTDIIHFGNDLASYLHNEFGVPLPDWAATAPKPVPFWDTLVHEEGFIRNW